MEARLAPVWRSLDTLRRDLTSAVRAIRRSPGFAALVVGTMALGIGANAAMFSITRAVLLRPLPFPEPDRLVTVWESDPERAVAKRRVTGANFVDWRAEATVFDVMAALPNWAGSVTTFNVGAAGAIERVPGAYASSGLFRTLGVSPLIGQGLEADDDRQPGRRRVVLSAAYWRERFGGDANVLGRTIDIDTFRGGAFTIVGVMPPEFDFPRGARIWLSLADWGGGPLPSPDSADRGVPFYDVVARLRPGVTPDRAARELTAIARRLEQRHPQASRVTRVEVVPLRETLVGEHRRPLGLLFGAVGCVLLVGCANVANLVLSRGIGRRGELLIRMALGATRARLARQSIADGLVLCGLGALAGLILAAAVHSRLAQLVATHVPMAGDSRIDVAVLTFTALVTVVCGVLCGLVPMVGWRRLDWRTRIDTENKATKHLRHALVVSEVALAVVLVATAGLLARTLNRLQAVDVGFDVHQLLSVSMDVTTGPLRGRGNAAQFVEALVPRIAVLPGVRNVGVTTGTLLEEGSAEQPITREDRVALTAAESPHVVQTAVTPGYFETLGVALVRGRALAEADTAQGQLVAVINESAARQHWPGEDPIGKRFAIGSRDRFGRFRAPTGPDDREREWREIVGVVADIRSGGFDAPVQPEIFYSYKQFPLYSPVLLVRTAGEPATLTQAVRREIAAVNASAVVTDARTMDQVASESVAEPRLRALLVGAFSTLALVLALLGIYGVLSYTVGQRTHEIGIRMALGATRAGVSRMVLGQALGLTSIGIVAGLAGAAATAQWMATLLFGVQPLDMPTFAATCVALLVTALIAGYGPARTATRVDPAVALRPD